MPAANGFCCEQCVYYEPLRSFGPDVGVCRIRAPEAGVTTAKLPGVNEAHLDGSGALVGMGVFPTVHGINDWCGEGAHPAGSSSELGEDEPS